MAIVVCGGVITGIRGTVGGVTYSANKAGPYARLWSRGANPRTQSQTVERANLSELAAMWRDIDPVDRALWDVYAADPLQELTNSLGEAYYISGFLWWVKLSRNLASLGRDPIETLCPFGAPAAPTIDTLVVGVGAVASEITFAVDQFVPDYDCVIELAIGSSIGASAMPVKPLFLQGDQLPAGPSIDISASILERFGSISVGQKAFGWVSRQTLRGRRSAPFAIACDVVS